MFGDPNWRFRCPNGHAAIRIYHTMNECQCYSCGLRWEGEPIDAKEVDSLPVDFDQHKIRVVSA